MASLSFKKICTFLVLINSSLAFACATQITPFISVRSQGQDLARYLSGVSQYVDLYGKEEVYGVFSLVAEYTESFRDNKLAGCLFGNYTCNSNCPAAVIPISGSRVENRGATDWLADYFYLPTDFQSTLFFSPRIQNLIFDVDLYMGLDKWAEGLFFRFQMPVVWTRWNLNMQEKVTNRGTNNYDPGYFDSYILDATMAPPIGVGVFRDALLENFTAYVGGDTVVLNPTVTFTQLKNAKINPCFDAKTSVADLHFTLGYNALNCESYHAGLGLYLVAPTGNRVLGMYFFEPIVGNGKHWEIGAWLTGNADLWTNCDETISAGFYADATITYMFPTLQTRTFDLKNKPFSRYMVAEQLGNPIVDGLVGTNEPPVEGPFTKPFAQFQKVFAPVANFSTQDVLVTVGVQADIVAQFSFVWHHMQWDIGYNFWARSCEKLTGLCTGAPCLLAEFPEQKWALKGDAYVFGFEPTTGGESSDAIDFSTALSATQSKATITSGTNFAGVDVSNPAAVNEARRNPNIDAPQFAVADATVGNTPVALSATIGGPLPEDQTRTSIQPVFITGSDLDLVGTRGLSNKIYTNISYNWSEHEYWTPYLGVGGFAEFGATGGASTQTCVVNNNCANSNSCTNTCVKCAVSQWGLWLKGGVAF